MKILVLDNYDSFTFNLVHILRSFGLSNDLEIYRNDKIHLDQVDNYDCILLSPGPGLPRDAGIMPKLIEQYGSRKSILGVCLGHQAIGETYGARLYNLKEVYHGVVTNIIVTGSDFLFNDIPSKFKMCRYHSWAVSNENLPQELVLTSMDEDGCIMSIKHRDYNLHGVQFHPESIMSEYGKKMIHNWLELSGK
jgi:anthranilate synthase component II